MTRLHRALAVTALAIGILAGPLAGQAFAAPNLPPGVNAPARATSALICSNGSTPGYASAAAAASSYLPIDRWGSVAGGALHTRLHASTIINGFSNITQKVERNVIESKALVMGNSLWRAGTDLTSMASRFCFADQAGAAADHFAAALGNALEKSGVVVALLIASLLIVFWRAARRSERPLRGLVRPMVVTGLLWAMVSGAQATTTSGGTVHFGTFSPGWIVTRAYDAIDQVASVPAAAFATQSNKFLGTGNNSSSLLGEASNPPPLSCAAYVNSLLSYYKDTYGANASNQFAASVPMALNAMWMQTGLRAYTDVQFGSQNPFGPYSYCRLLESQAGVPFKSQIAITSLSYGGKMNPQALAWTTAGDTNNTVDRSMVGWAACRPSGSTWTVAPPWGQVKNPNSSSSITLGICGQWWSSGNFTSRGTALDWTSSSSNIVAATAKYPTVGNFLLNFHGDANATAEATAVTYALASIVVFVVFAVLSLAVVIAKVALLVMMMLAVPVMLIALVPSAGVSNRAMGVAKHTLSLIVFSTGAQILLALIAILTGMIVGMSGAITGQGSFFDILLTSLAPIAAIVLLHHFFKKVLKAPSPFKPTSALAWGAAAGGVGAGVGEGIDKLIHRGGGRAVRSAGSQAVGRARAGFGAPRPHRVGGMTAPAPNGNGSTSPNGRRPGGPPTNGSRGGSPGAGTGTGAPGAGGRAGATAGAAGATAAGTAAGAATGAAAGATAAGTADWWADQSAPGGNAGAASRPSRPRSMPPPPPDGGATVPPQSSPPPPPRPNTSGHEAAAAASVLGAAGVDTALRDEAAARHASRFGARDYRWARAKAAGGQWGLAKEMARDRANAAWERAADRPARTALKVAGAATLGAAALPFVGVGTATAAAAVYGTHKTLQFHRERKATAPARAKRNQQAYTAARAAGLAERPHPIDAAVYGASPAARRVAWDARARYDFWRLKRANANPRPGPDPGPAPTGRTGARPVGGSRLG